MRQLLLLWQHFPVGCAAQTVWASQQPAVQSLPQFLGSELVAIKAGAEGGRIFQGGMEGGST
jgi:hypothetical protein